MEVNGQLGSGSQVSRPSRTAGRPVLGLADRPHVRSGPQQRSKVEVGDYGAILFAGGHGPMFDFTDNAQADGRLVTGQNPASATPLAEALVRVICTQGAPR